MRFDVRPVGKAGRIASRLETRDVPVDHIQVDDRAGRAEPFDDILFQRFIGHHCWHCLLHRKPSPRSLALRQSRAYRLLDPGAACVRLKTHCMAVSGAGDDADPQCCPIPFPECRPV